jgi:LPXTG-motif cell wall-anchored protein
MLGYRPEYPSVGEDERPAPATFGAKAIVVAGVFAILLALVLLRRRRRLAEG